MKTITNTLLIIMMSIEMLTAQSIVFEKTYGNQSSDQAGYSVKQTSDTGYIMIGGNDIFKTDSYGNQTWTEIFAGDGKWVEEINNAYIFCGTRGGDIYVEKRDLSGSLLWNKTYGSSSTDDYGYSIRETFDGGLIITGYIDSLNSVRGMHLIKTDPSGGMLWEKVYEYGMDEKGFSIQETTDSGFIITGHSEFSGSDITNIFKTNSTGDMQWNNSVLGACRDIIQTADGGYVAIGDKPQTFGIYNDVYILKLNASGQTEWDNSLGDYALDEAGNAIVQTQDGGYVISGTKREQQGQGTFFYSQAMLLKLDPLGNYVWRTFFGNTQVSQSYGYDIEICNDGGFTLVGSRRINNYNHFDFYLVKTNHLGAIDSSVVTSIYEPGKSAESSIYPNPMTDHSSIQLKDTEDQIMEINIYDRAGKMVRREQGNRNNQQTIKKENLIQGHYFIEVISKKGIIKKSIWIK